MTIETLEKRIEGKKVAIEKLLAKIGRIKEAKASNWEKNPYYYDEQDLRDAYEDLEKEQDSLQKYLDQLEQEEAKAGSRNVKVLMDFLETWKVNSIEWFKEEKARYEEAKAEYYAKSHELTDRWNSRIRLGLSKEEVKAIEVESRELKANFTHTWMHVIQFNHGSLSWEETLERDLEIEKNRKYDDIIERTVAIVGTITDASNLRVGSKGDLNGFIIGDKGTAKVETIGAGGWNIQRAHFRTLVHKM